MPSPVNRAVPAGRVIIRGDLLYSSDRTQSPNEVAHDYSAWDVPGAELEHFARPSLPVGPEWSKLPLGWDEDSPAPAVLHLRHLTGTSRQKIPSPEELAEEAKLVVEIGVSREQTGIEIGPVPFALLEPGRAPQRFAPVPGLSYHVRCPAGACKIALVAIPRGDR